MTNTETPIEPTDVDVDEPDESPLGRFRRRVAVVLGAVPTWLTAIAVIAGILLDELPKLGPLPQWLISALGGVIAVVAVAVAIVRRVTPVVDGAIGLLDSPASAAVKALTAGGVDKVLEARLVELQNERTLLARIRELELEADLAGRVAGLEATIAELRAQLPAPPTE